MALRPATRPTPLTPDRSPPDPDRRPPPALTALLRRVGWRRAVLLRRGLAGVLVVLAAVLALRPAGTAATGVVVAVRDLPPGVVVAAADLAVRDWPPDLVPAGALTAVVEAEGKVLAGALRTGEPVTDLRLAGAPLAVLAAGTAEAAAVPVRLADPEVAALLTPGTRVDVVVAAPRAGEPTTLAPDAVVLTVLEPGPGANRGRAALVALPRQLATRVAVASLSDQVAVTLRSPA